MAVIALLNAGAQIQLRPARLVFAPVIIAHLEVVAAIQVKLPHVLYHRVAPDAPTRPVMHVVVHLPVVHQRAAPQIQVAAVTAEPGRVLHRASPADQMNGRQTLHHVCLERDVRRHTRAHGAMPRRDAVVNEIGKVRLWIIGVGYSDAHSRLARGRDAIAHQAPVRLQRTGQHRRVNAVAGQVIAARSRVIHRYCRPVVRVGGVGQLNVTAGIDKLVLHADTLDAVRVGDFRGDLHRLAGGWLSRTVVHLPNCRRQLAGIDRVDPPRGRAMRGRAAARQQPQIEEEIAARAQARIGGLNRQDVRAGNEITLRRVQIEMIIGAILARRYGRPIERQFPARNVRVEHVRAVDPDLDTVVIQRFERQRADRRRVVHDKFRAEENRGVVRPHVGQVSSHRQGRIVTNRRRAGRPTRIVEVQRAPGRAWKRRLAQPFEIFPGRLVGNESLALLDGIAGD